jgi:hypothetical protein
VGGSVTIISVSTNVGEKVEDSVSGAVVGDDVTHSPSSVIFSSAVPANKKFPLLNAGDQRLRAWNKSKRKKVSALVALIVKEKWNKDARITYPE